MSNHFEKDTCFLKKIKNKSFRREANMLLCLQDEQSVKIEFGHYGQDSISLKNIMKVYVDDFDIHWSGFFPIDSECVNIHQQNQYTLLSYMSISLQDSYQIAEKLLIHVDSILEKKIKNPSLKNNKSKQKFSSLFDAEQQATVAAILYRLKLNGGYSAVIGSRDFLSIEELIFLENCIEISPYLKRLHTARISTDDFAIAVRFAYRHILNKRMKFESFMDLNPKVLAYVYNDFPNSTIGY